MQLQIRFTRRHYFSDGRILTAGLTGDGDTVYFSMLMMNSDGSRNTAFAPNGVFKNIFGQNNNSGCSSMDITHSGKILLAGYTRTCANGVCGPISVATARYNGASAPNGSSSIKKDNNFKIYPNPIGQNEVLNISGVNDLITKFQIRAMDGRVVQSAESISGKNIKINRLPSGLYLAEISTEKKSYTAKLFVN